MSVVRFIVRNVCLGSFALAAVSGVTWADDSGHASGEATADARPTGDATEPFERRDPFHLRPVEMLLEMEAEYQQRRVHSESPRSSYRRDRASTHKNRDYRLAESFGITLDGDIYDPDLLEYSAMLKFGLSQNRYVEEIDQRRYEDGDFGFLQEYDVTVDVLKTKPFTLNAYARRYDDRIPRKFLPSLRERMTEFGVSGLLTYGPTTTEVGLSWRDVDRAGNRLDEDNEDLEVSRFYLDHTWAISEDQQLRVQYDHGREQNTYQGSVYDFDTRRDEFRIEHDLAFGSQRQHRLDTYFRYNEEQGDLARDELELVPRLTLQHTDTFKTIYRYGFYRFEQDAIEVNQHKWDAQALYTPDEHWRISLDGYGLYERVDLDVDTQEYGGGLDVAFNHETSLGELHANAAFGVDSSRTTGDAGRRVVRGESHRLGGSRHAILNEQNIEIGTLLVYNADRSRYYIPGVDYLLLPIGPWLRVDRIPTGRIADDEVVYFDYQYIVPAHASVVTYNSDFLIEHRFSFGLTPYYAYESRCEHANWTAGTPRLRDNMHRHRFGLRYGRPTWEVGTEGEFYDDTVEPYDAWHLTGRWAIVRTATHSLDGSMELSRYWYEGGLDDRRVWWFDVDVTDRVRINEFLAVRAGAAYRWEDDSVDSDSNAVDVQAGLEFIRGYLSVDLSVEYDLLALANNRDQSFGVFLNVRRDLSHLLVSPGRGTR